MSQLLAIGALVTVGLLGVEPSVQELTDGIHRRIREFRNLQFEYNVDATFWPAPVTEYDASGNPKSTKPGSGPPKIVKSKDVFRILDSNRPDVDRPWRFWQQSIEEEGHWVVKEFLTYDGQHTALYFRREPDSKNDFSTGGIIPFESYNYYEDNIFDRFLCTDLNGLAEYQDPGWKLSRGVVDHWKNDGTVEFEGQTAYVLRVNKPGIDGVVHVIGFPHFLVIYHGPSPGGKPDTGPLMRWEVTSLGDFNGRLYPSGGTFTQSSVPSLPRIEYSFRVTAVKPLDDSAREHWRPEWPSGTVVRDHVDNQNTTVSYAEGEHEKVMALRSRLNKEQPPSLPSTQGRLMLLIINISGILVLITWWAMSSTRSRRNSSRPQK